MSKWILKYCRFAFINYFKTNKSVHFLRVLDIRKNRLTSSRKCSFCSTGSRRGERAITSGSSFSVISGFTFPVTFGTLFPGASVSSHFTDFSSSVEIFFIFGISKLQINCVKLNWRSRAMKLKLSWSLRKKYLGILGYFIRSGIMWAPLSSPLKGCS